MNAAEESDIRNLGKQETPYFYEIADLEDPLSVLAARMVPELRQKNYSLLIGDDVSGRLPAMCLWKALKEICASQDFDVPPLHFVVTGRLGRKGEERPIIPSHAIRSRLKRVLVLGGYQRGLLPAVRRRVLNSITDTASWIPLVPEKKVAICTELIRTGAGLRQLTKILQQRGIRFDLYTVGITDHFESERIRQRLGADALIYGTEDFGKLKIYLRDNMTGVAKPETLLPGSPLVVERKDIDGAIKEPLSRENMPHIRARQDISILAKRIAQRMISRS